MPLAAGKIEIKCTHSRVLPIEELKKRFHPRNRNTHDADQLKQLALILKHQGIRAPAILSKLSGKLVTSHGRILAAESIGMTEYPVDDQDFEDDEQEYQHLVADNAIAKQAILDFKSINEDLKDLGPFNVDLLGLKDFKAIPEDKYEDQDADAVPEVKESFVKTGELWLLGNHRLLVGDCTIKENVERLMAGEKADMVYTDPPYGMNLDAEAFGRKNIQGDDQQFDPAHILVSFKYCEDILIYGSDYFVELLGRKWPDLGSWLIWDKCKEIGIDTDWSGRYGSEFETIWSKRKIQRKIIRALPKIGFFAKKDETRVHPTQKPAKLHELIFDWLAKDKTNIVDLYLGSGSTLIACEKTNRKCYGMEIDEHYSQVIIDRWEKFTGLKAKREDGKTLDELKQAS